jgi:Ser/Thr protein kinase RdoA (MazF antagonist)
MSGAAPVPPPDIGRVAGALLAAQYGAPDARLHPLAPPAGNRGVFRVDGPSGGPWTARVYGGAPSHWLAWLGADLPAWLAGQAAVLGVLEAHGYPAPRVVPTTAGAAVGTHGGWHALVTTHVAGRALAAAGAPAAPDDLRALGAALGALHALAPGRGPAGSAGGAPVPVSRWQPARAVPYALTHLAAAPAGRRAGLRALRAAFGGGLEEALGAVEGLARRGELAPALIHGDCWPGNAVRARGGRAVLVDWENAGAGPAVVDLAALLVSSQPAPCWGPPFRADEVRLAAVLEGYGRHRTLGPGDLAHLPQVVRFEAAYYAARDFAHAPRPPGRPDAGWPRLPRLRASAAAADALAAAARAVVDRAPPR